MSPLWVLALAIAQPIDLMKDVGLDQKLGAQVPLDLGFRDESGAQVRLRDLIRGEKPVVLNLVYYDCPMLCGLVLNGQLRALRALKLDVGKEFDIVTVSIDPKEQPPLAREKKRSFIDQYKRDGAEKGWHFLTGEEANIRALAASVGFRYVYDPNAKQYAHAAGIMVLSAEGVVTRYLYGVEYSARDLKLGLMEASDGKIGSPVDQVLLWCYHYDPNKGKYTLAIMGVIRALALMTVAGLGLLIGGSLRKERRDVA